MSLTVDMIEWGTGRASSWLTCERREFCESSHEGICESMWTLVVDLGERHSD